MVQNYTLLNRDGAKALKDKIVDYWRKRGANVDVRLEAEPHWNADLRCVPVHPRSNLVDGLPPKSAYTEQTQ